MNVPKLHSRRYVLPFWRSSVTAVERSQSAPQWNAQYLRTSAAAMIHEAEWERNDRWNKDFSKWSKFLSQQGSTFSFRFVRQSKQLIKPQELLSNCICIEIKYLTCEKCLRESWHYRERACNLFFPGVGGSEKRGLVSVAGIYPTAIMAALTFARSR